MQFRAADIEDIRHAIHDNDNSMSHVWLELFLFSSFFLRHSDEVDDAKDIKFYAHHIYPEVDGKVYGMIAYLINQDEAAVARLITTALRGRSVVFKGEKGGGLIVRSALGLVEVEMADVSRAAETVNPDALPVAGRRRDEVVEVTPEALALKRRDRFTDALHRLPTLLRNSAHKWSR